MLRTSIVTCRACGEPLQWEQLGGMRVYAERGGVRLYRARCDCGEREVTADGKPPRPRP